VLRVPSSAHVVCRGKDSGKGSGRSYDVKGAYLWFAIMHLPPLCISVEGVRASGSVVALVDVVLCAWKCV
jgi:hypothetical protein